MRFALLALVLTVGGHGLSYTKFQYSHMTVTAEKDVEVAFDLTNVGDRAGSDVAQFYTHQRFSSVVQPIKSLRGFERVSLAAGETNHVRFTLPMDRLGFYDVRPHGTLVEGGAYDVFVGASSEDIRLKGVATVPAARKVQATTKK